VSSAVRFASGGGVTVQGGTAVFGQRQKSVKPRNFAVHEQGALHPLVVVVDVVVGVVVVVEVIGAVVVSV
jgi:hypothetical protein